jgi:hypothetical protein
MDGIGYGEVITRRESRAIAFACDVVIGHREAEAGGDGPAAGSHLHHPSFGDLDVLAYYCDGDKRRGAWALVPKDTSNT